MDHLYWSQKYDLSIIIDFYELKIRKIIIKNIRKIIIKNIIKIIIKNIIKIINKL